MKRSFRYMFFLAVLAQAGTVEAKTAFWSAAPQYNQIEMITPGAYMVRRGIYTGVIDANGKNIVAMTTDSITPFSEGQALIITPAEGRYRLQGILHAETLTTSPVYEEVYVDDYPFFSEGLLPVCNSKGFYGYMDPQGRMVLKPSYINIHPFSNGLAAVVKRPSNAILQFLSKGADKVMELLKQKIKYIYINPAGTEMKVDKSVGDIYNATTFKNGVALVENKDGEYYLINNRGKMVRAMSARDWVTDDHYAYVDPNVDEDEGIGFSEVNKGTENKNVKIFTEGDLYGYRTAESVVLPPQFTDAEPFVDGHALACVGAKWGILQLADGSFSCSMPSASKATARKGKGKRAAAPAKSSGYVVTIPQDWASKDLTLTLKSADKSETATTESNGTDKRTFSLAAPASASTCTVGTDNLILWQGTTGSTGAALAQESGASRSTGTRLRISISPSSAKADIKDNASVSVALTNPGDSPVSTVVKVAGNNLVPVSRSVTIPAHGTRRVSTVFTKVYGKEVRAVSVTANGQHASKSVTLNPFYVKF